MVTPPEEVPAGAVPTGAADRLWFANRQVWTDPMMEALRRGGPEGGRWYWLHDKVFAARTLRVAYAQVAANGGAPGVDGVTVEVFGERLEEEIARLLADWKSERFRPQPVRRVWIPKPGSDEQRPLGIPTVRDRVVQAALRLVLEPIFEMDFHARSHGFRPGRSAKDALTEVVAGLDSGQVWVVDADLKGYFDSIPHGLLLKAVQRRVTDRRILGLIEGYLKAGIMEDGEVKESESGSPQGGVISPLLANIYLNDLDHTMAQAGWTMTRYADDFVILCQTQAEAERALADVQTWTGKAGLFHLLASSLRCGAASRCGGTQAHWACSRCARPSSPLHPTKTRIVDLGQPGTFIDFLGFRLQRHRDKHGRDRLLRLVRPKSLTKTQDAIRQRTRRTSGESLEEIIRQLNQVLSGWFAYFRSAHHSIHHRLDQTVRRRLRAILAKRRGAPNWGGGRGHNRWPNAYFVEHGLISLKDAHERYLHPC